jgi:hypothetical protein
MALSYQCAVIINNDALLPGDIIATVQGTISSQQRAGREYLHLDTLAIDLNIKTVRMLVKKVFNNNRILSKYDRFATSCATSVRAATPSPQPRVPRLLPSHFATSCATSVRAATPSPQPRVPRLLSSHFATSCATSVQAATPSPQPRVPRLLPSHFVTTEHSS